MKGGPECGPMDTDFVKRLLDKVAVPAADSDGEDRHLVEAVMSGTGVTREDLGRLRWRRMALAIKERKRSGR